jgi:alkaline phosphatase
MVADGAGVTHWTLALFADSGLAVRQFPVAGLVDTRGAGHEVTGSAPGATAYSTGRRSFMGAIGVGADSMPVETVLEIAASRGMATGLITTTYVVDATPAAFAAHNASRAELDDIAAQMGEAGLTVLMGGGRRAFDGSWRPDSTDLIAQLRQRHTYVETGEELRALDLDTVTTLVGLFAESGMGVVDERSPSLSAMVQAALTVLDRDADGFFLLIENEETDTQAHRNVGADTLVAEMLDFDRAIRLALDYHRTHPRTLIVVTADHETGGGTLTPGEGRTAMLQYATGDHTAGFVPLFAIGPAAERFGGLKENREIGQLLQELLRPTQ